MAAVEDQAVTTGSAKDESRLQDLAKRHLWMHFTQMAGYEDHEIPIITRGDGCYVWDEHGNKYLDGLAALFCVNIGHGRGDVAQAGADQAKELGFYTNWSYAHPKAIELAARVAELAPGDLNRVFFTSGGSEAVDSALKLCRQYHKLTGNPGRYKVISRKLAYHGTTMGALTATGIPAVRRAVRADLPGLGARAEHERLPARGRRPGRGDLREDPVRGAGDRLVRDPRAGAELGRLLHARPTATSSACARSATSSGSCFISDEVICSWGRLGTYFGAEKYDYQPDIITTAKGITSSYAPMGAVIATDRMFEPFSKPAQLVHARDHVRRPPGRRGRRARQPRRVRQRGDHRERRRARAGVRRRCSTRCATSRSSATCAASATSARSSWCATRRPRRPSPATRRSGCCAASSRPRCSGAG